MKHKTLIPIILALMLFAHNSIQAESSAWTYQGHLGEDGQGATGVFNMAFRLFPTATGGEDIASVTNQSVVVSNGLFTTTLDLGDPWTSGEEYWLEIAVQAYEVGEFITLSPRQVVNPVPYALYAQKAMDVINPSFLGTTMALPLELLVNDVGAFRFEPTASTPNLVGGYEGNYALDGVGITIAGGGIFDGVSTGSQSEGRIVDWFHGE